MNSCDRRTGTGPRCPWSGQCVRIPGARSLPVSAEQAPALGWVHASAGARRRWKGPAFSLAWRPDTRIVARMWLMAGHL